MGCFRENLWGFGESFLRFLRFLRVFCVFWGLDLSWGGAFFDFFGVLRVFFGGKRGKSGGGSGGNGQLVMYNE
jgi:hypothetical protein